MLRVRNKPRLGWQVKTRNQRDVPLVPALATCSGFTSPAESPGPSSGVGGGATTASGSMRPRPRLWSGNSRGGSRTPDAAERNPTGVHGCGWPGGVWRDVGAVDETRIRVEFMRAARAAGLAGQTAPKVLRHQFATALQEGRVDPLVRNLLMGHASPRISRPRGTGWG